MRGLVASAACLLAFQAAEAALDGPDPRPHVLVLGGPECLANDFGPGWPLLLAADLPQYRFTILARGAWTLADAPAQLDDLLETCAPADAVLVLFGLDEARAQQFSPQDGAKRYRDRMLELLRKLRGHAVTKQARLGVITPVPIIDAWLDPWMLQAFSPTKNASGESASRVLAQVFKDAAGQVGAEILDLHSWARIQDGQGNYPNRLVDATGVVIPEAGQSRIAAFVGRGLCEQIRPEARRPDIYQRWLRLQDDLRFLRESLAQTAQGSVDCGPPLELVVSQDDMTKVVVPSTALREGNLDLLVKADSQEQAVILVMGNDIRSQRGVTLEVDIVGRDEPLRLVMPGHSWQIIAEDRPDTVIPRDEHFLNSGGVRWRALVCRERGKQRWLLLRIPLERLGAEKVGPARLTLFHGPIEQNHRALGSVAVFPVRGLDRAWTVGKATWRTCYQGPWTGGTVNVMSRKAALRAFLSQDRDERAKAIAYSLLMEEEPPLTVFPHF